MNHKPPITGILNPLNRDGLLVGATILPLSAAQLIMPGDMLSDGRQTGDVEARRRIEIRIRGHADQVVTGEGVGTAN